MASSCQRVMIENETCLHVLGLIFLQLNIGCRTDSCLRLKDCWWMLKAWLRFPIKLPISVSLVLVTDRVFICSLKELQKSADYLNLSLEWVSCRCLLGRIRKASSLNDDCVDPFWNNQYLSIICQVDRWREDGTFS